MFKKATVIFGFLTPLLAEASEMARELYREKDMHGLLLVRHHIGNGSKPEGKALPFPTSVTTLGVGAVYHHPDTYFSGFFNFETNLLRLDKKTRTDSNSYFIGGALGYQVVHAVGYAGLRHNVFWRDDVNDKLRSHLGAGIVAGKEFLFAEVWTEENSPWIYETKKDVDDTEFVSRIGSYHHKNVTLRLVVPFIQAMVEFGRFDMEANEYESSMSIERLPSTNFTYVRPSASLHIGLLRVGGGYNKVYSSSSLKNLPLLTSERGFMHGHDGVFVDLGVGF